MLGTPGLRGDSNPRPRDGRSEGSQIGLQGNVWPGLKSDKELSRQRRGGMVC